METGYWHSGVDARGDTREKCYDLALDAVFLREVSGWLEHVA